MTAHRVELAADLASVSAARRFVGGVLKAAGLEELLDDAQLATSELVANAVRHAGTDVALKVEVGDEVRVTVDDGQPELRRPLPGVEDGSAESGRGLRIVSAVASDWGIALSATGKSVWFALARPLDGTDDADVRSITGRPASSATRPPADSTQCAEEQATTTG